MAESTECAVILFKAHKDIPKGSQLVFRDGQLWVWREGPERARQKKFQEIKLLWDKLLQKTARDWGP